MRGLPTTRASARPSDTTLTNDHHSTTAAHPFNTSDSCRSRRPRTQSKDRQDTQLPLPQENRLPNYTRFLDRQTVSHPFNGLFSRTTWASRNQKDTSLSLDFNEARDDGGTSGTSWTICKSFAPRSRQITTPVPHHSILQAGCPSYRQTNSDKALKADGVSVNVYFPLPPFFNSKQFPAHLQVALASKNCGTILTRGVKKRFPKKTAKPRKIQLQMLAPLTLKNLQSTWLLSNQNQNKICSITVDRPV